MKTSFISGLCHHSWKPSLQDEFHFLLLLVWMQPSKQMTDGIKKCCETKSTRATTAPRKEHTNITTIFSFFFFFFFFFITNISTWKIKIERGVPMIGVYSNQNEQEIEIYHKKIFSRLLPWNLYKLVRQTSCAIKSESEKSTKSF